MQSNFILKVENAKLPDVQKALKGAGVKVKSIVEIHKEKNEQVPEQAKEEQAKSNE